MGIKTLAESIILQSIEDMYHPEHRTESLEFFTGHGFHVCAKLAGMGVEDKLSMLDFVKQYMKSSGSVMGNKRAHRKGNVEHLIAAHIGAHARPF